MNHLTVCQKMSSSLFKCYLQNVFRNHIFNEYLQKDLALNNLQCLICHQTKPSWKYFFFISTCLGVLDMSLNCICEVLVLEIWVMWSTPSLPLLSWRGCTFRVLSMGQIEIFNHLSRIIISNLEPYSCVKIVCIR